MSDNRLEYLVIKYTLGGAFLVATLMFGAKVLGLLVWYFQSGKAWADFQNNMPEAIRHFWQK